MQKIKLLGDRGNVMAVIEAPRGTGGPDVVRWHNLIFLRRTFETYVLGTCLVAD